MLLRALLVVLSTLLVVGSATGCMRHGGSTDLAWHPAQRPTRSDTATHSTPYTLILLGDAGAPTPEAKAVAAQVDRVVAAERAAGRHPLVLWLGNDRLHPSGSPRRCPTSSASALVQWSQQHPEVQQFATGGPAQWHCAGGTASDMQPAPSYVLRLHEGGRTEIASRCIGGRCVVSPPAEPPMLELVVADWTPWIEAERGRMPRSPLDALATLMRALDPEPTWPRLLVSHYPAEAAGYHGLGGGEPDAFFHVLPPAVRDAIARGAFAGMLAGHDRATYLERDLTDAIKRSDKVWLRRPFFQVVAGASSMPDARLGRHHRRLHRRTSIAYRPDLYSPHEGFAVVHIGRDSAQATLWARVDGSWQTSRVPLDVSPAEHPVETQSPKMAPCRDCLEREHVDDF